MADLAAKSTYKMIQVGAKADMGQQIQAVMESQHNALT